MGNKSVQMLFSDQEYRQLENKAAEVGLTVPLYIRGVVLEENEFSKSYEKLIEKFDALSSGTEFTIRALFGTDWNMSRGVKLALGKTFNNRVTNKIIKNVKELGKDSSNVMHYKKL